MAINFFEATCRSVTSEKVFGIIDIPPSTLVFNNAEDWNVWVDNANEKEIYLFPNKLGYIEITFYKGAIAMLGDLKINDTIEIQFT